MNSSPERKVTESTRLGPVACRADKRRLDSAVNTYLHLPSPSWDNGRRRELLLRTDSE